MNAPRSIGAPSIPRAVALLLLAACSSAAPPTARVDGVPAAAVATTPCPVPPAVTTEEWRLVPGSGFSFCVPTSWRQVGAREWRGDGSVSWGANAGRRAPFVISSVDRGAPPPPSRPVERDRRRESIAGKEAELSILVVGSRHLTSARWEAPRLVFSGEAPSTEAARLQLDIFRTVRFTSP